MIINKKLFLVLALYVGIVGAPEPMPVDSIIVGIPLNVEAQEEDTGLGYTETANLLQNEDDQEHIGARIHCVFCMSGTFVLSIVATGLWAMITQQNV